MSETPIRYASPREPLPEGAACAGCGSSALLVRDHCHEHGWMRGIVCMSCNTRLALLDRRLMPLVDAEHLAALLAIRNSCPDCESLDASDLTTGSLRGAGARMSFKEIPVQLPNALYAGLKGAAGRSRRSLHAEILWRLERDLGRDEKEAQPS